MHLPSRNTTSLILRERGLASVLGATAAALGAAAVANYVLGRRAERRHPPQGRFLTVDGVRLHYVEHGNGSGPPVVLLHGNGAMVEDWLVSGVLDRVARQHRVIAFDRPGFGHSARPRRRVWTPRAQANLIHAALRKLGVERPVLVGHSWGTLVALSMALDNRLGTAAAVLVSGYYVPSARSDVVTMTGPAVPVLGDVQRYTVSPPLGRLMAPGVFRKLFAPEPVTPAFQAGFPTELALRPWQIRAAAADTALMIPGAASLFPHHGELAVPTTIVAGAEDEIVDTERQSAVLHRRVPGSELRVVPGAGHMVHHTHPDAVADAILDAARQAAPRLEAPAPALA